MEISDILYRFSSQEKVSEITGRMGSVRTGRFLVSGICSSAVSFFVGSVFRKYGRINVFIASDKENAAYMAADLDNIVGSEHVVFLPSSSRLSATGKLVQDDSQKVQRTAAIGIMKELDASSSKIFVTYPHAVTEGFPKKDSVNRSILAVDKGESVSHDTIKRILSENSFEKVDFVTEPGQYALRGSIIDVFSFSDSLPYRIDFFGDEVECIRKFDVNRQTSVGEVEHIEIYPDIQESGARDGFVSFFDYLRNLEVNVFFENHDMIMDTVSVLSGSSADNYVDKDYLAMKLSECRQFHFCRPSSIETDAEYEFSVTPQPSFNKNFEILSADIMEKTRSGYTVCILSDNDSQIDRLRQIFSDSKYEVRFQPVRASVHSGFIDSASSLAVYTDHQIFNRYHKAVLRNTVEKSERITLADLNAFHIGDYIVHIDHGVGIYGGIVRTSVNGKVQEAVKLIYKDKDVIFVSVHALHRISRYRSKDGTPPKIYKLGSGAWQKLKSQTKKKVKDIARDLIKLYSERRATGGFAFSPDTYMQHELEASFMYEDTPDQLTATAAVKSDMEKGFPMDRLICGDVGFGKTEIAVRAAFKAVADSKQVAVLVPTTILALQHYNTFRNRLSKFPCNVEFISRLRTAKEIKDIMARLQKGQIDILIGTHRLLNKEIVFKDLGLLIIDEEHKFGVAAKEKLRQMKVSVDTLTLSATPIPRTLQFSLLGARDMSVINTPPPNRLPVHTEIITFDEETIRNVVSYEIERGGQVYFIHNRVEDILAVEDMIRRLVPNARTCVGHGQMDASALEKIILDFIAGDYDVLIATTIVENGIDIPNANTIIINQAQNFGLSDLHQLRGRVGRSNRKAYCYLVTPPMIALTDDSRRRLKAIEMFSDLGSGFNIAMQDLDIRGAGNLLGGEQSGFIADMGYETYQRILSEAFDEIRAEEGFVQEKETDCTFATDPVIDIDMEVMIPDSYVGNSNEKIRLYRELDSLKNEQEISRFVSVLEDRFGRMPETVSELVNVVRLRIEASRLSMDKVTLKNGIMLAYFIADPASDFYQSEKFGKIMEVIMSRPMKLRLKEKFNRLYISVPDIPTVASAVESLKEIVW